MGAARILLLIAAIAMSVSAVFEPVPPPNSGSFSLSFYRAGWALFLWALFAGAFVR